LVPIHSATYRQFTSAAGGSHEVEAPLSHASASGPMWSMSRLEAEVTHTRS
jgi:hypothetical protein